MYLNDGELNDYLNKKCGKFNLEVIKTDKLAGKCIATTIKYDNKYMVLIDENVKDKLYKISVLHELSHIELNFIGPKYEKRSKNNLYEKIVNLHMVWSNRKILDRFCVVICILSAIISEDLLYRTIRFKKQKSN